MNTDAYSRPAIRRAIWHFLSGKAVSALLTFVILVSLVRLLPVAEYGAYVVLLAGTELGFVFASLGLPWLAARYLPDYRLHAAGPVLVRLCRQLIMWQALALVALAAVIAFVMDAYLLWADLSTHSVAAWIALALLVFEGLGRFVCEGLLAPLMLQGQARISLVLRQLSFLAAIGMISLSGRADLGWILAAEVGSSFTAWIVASIALVWYLRAQSSQPGDPDWREPRLVEQWRVALRMYLAHLVTLIYGPQVFLNLIQRYLGAEATALFGFLRTLYGQVSRYLPATLLFTVIRPKFMVSHFQGGIADLARQVNFVGKLSLFVLLPLVVLVALVGDGLVAMLSSGKFVGGGLYLLGLLLALVPHSQRQLLETVAVANGRAGLCTLASAIGLLALPLMYVLLNVGMGLWAPVLAHLFGQLVFNIAVLHGLAGIGYRADWLGAAKLVASAVLAWLVACGVYSIDHSLIWRVLACLLASSVFLAAAWQLQAFTHEERQRFNGLLGRRLFAR